MCCLLLFLLLSWCFKSTIRLISDGEPRTATSTSTQLLSSAAAPHLFTQTHIFHSRFCEATRSRRPSRLPHRSWALSSSSVLLYANRSHKAYQGRGAQDGLLDFHTAPELCCCPLLVYTNVHFSQPFLRSDSRYTARILKSGIGVLKA